MAGVGIAGVESLDVCCLAQDLRRGQRGAAAELDQRRSETGDQGLALPVKLGDLLAAPVTRCVRPRPGARRTFPLPTQRLRLTALLTREPVSRSARLRVQHLQQHGKASMKVSQPQPFG